MDGLPAGETVDLEELQAFLDRRRPGQGVHTTARQEGDGWSYAVGAEMIS